METFKEIILVILQAVIISSIPVLQKYAVDFMKAKKNAAIDASDNDYIDAIIERVGTLVIDVVTETTQTYVEGLKKDGKFNLEEQGIAFNMSYNKLNELINDEYKSVLEEVFGNLQGYLTSKIESTIGLSKDQTVIIEQ